MFASPGAIAFQIPALFGFGPFPVRWYGILMATSIVVGLWLAHRQAKREGRPADRTLGQLLQRGGLRPADRRALEALHLALAPAAGLRPVRVLPPDVPLRVDLGRSSVHGARRVAAPVAAAAPGRALLLLHRPLFDRTLRHRGAAARQLLARRLPRAAARERARRHHRGDRAGVDAAALVAGDRQLSSRPAVSDARRAGP